MIENYTFKELNGHFFVVEQFLKDQIRLISIKNCKTIISTVNIIPFLKNLNENKVDLCLSEVDSLLLDLESARKYLKKNDKINTVYYKNELFFNLYNNFYLSENLKLKQLKDDRKFKFTSDDIIIQRTLKNLDNYYEILEKAYNKNKNEQ